MYTRILREIAHTFSDDSPKLPPLIAIKTLKAQLNAYNQGHPPFDRPFQSKYMSLRTWWEHVQRHENGAILHCGVIFTDNLDLGSYDDLMAQ